MYLFLGSGVWRERLILLGSASMTIRHCLGAKAAEVKPLSSALFRPSDATFRFLLTVQTQANDLRE